jgi:hypothetical protein
VPETQHRHRREDIVRHADPGAGSYCGVCGRDVETNPYVDEWGHHLGYCNNPDCGEEQELGLECQFCEIGEVVAYEDDPDPDGEYDY